MLDTEGSSFPHTHSFFYEQHCLFSCSIQVHGTRLFIWLWFTVRLPFRTRLAGRDTERGGAVDVLAAQLPRSPIDQAIRRGEVANGALVIFVNKKRELM